MPKSTEAGLRSLAGSKGYTPERAMLRDHWRLRFRDGKLAMNPRTNATAFSISEAMAFLEGRPDAFG